MVRGKSYPEPNGKVWVSAYVDSKKEYYEIRTEREGLVPLTQWHYECSLGLGLADFAHEDTAWMWEYLESIKPYIPKIHVENAGRNLQNMFTMAYMGLHLSPIYAPLAAAVECLRVDPSTERIEQMIREYERLHKQIQFIFSDCLEADKADNKLDYYMSQSYADKEKYPQLRYGELEMCVNIKNIKGVFDFDDVAELYSLNDEPREQADVFCAETLNCTDPQDLVYFMLSRYLMSNIRFRTCKYCGRSFGLMNNYNSEYCDRRIELSHKTCKEAGSLRLYEKKLYDDPAIKEYKRSYKAHNARIRYGLMTKEEFKAWSVEARRQRDLCVAGELPLADFIAWLDSDRID